MKPFCVWKGDKTSPQSDAVYEVAGDDGTEGSNTTGDAERELRGEGDVEEDITEGDKMRESLAGRYFR